MSRIAELLDKLHLLLGEDLIRRIEDGSATSADLSVARAFLKDHNIDVPKSDPHLAALTAAAAHHDADDVAPYRPH